MLSTFIIALREGLEASLILAILLTYLKKTDRWADARFVWAGTAAAIGICLVAGVAIFIALDGLNGKVEYAVEGFIALLATGVLTHMIFWMRSHARTLGKELRDKVDASVGSALAIIAFVAVLREGLETVLFLLSAETATASGSDVVVGGLIGLALSVVIGFGVYRSGNRLNLRTFFNVTAVLLLLFAAGLAGKAVHELRLLISWEAGWLVSSAWTLKSGLFATGTFYDFMRGLFGWHKNPENIRVLAYFAYLIPVLLVYLRGAKSVSVPTTTNKEASQVV